MTMGGVSRLAATVCALALVTPAIGRADLRRGAVDTRFSGTWNGVIRVDGGGHEVGTGVVALTDGRIVLTATSAPREVASTELLLTSFLSDGRPDRGFAGDGTMRVRVRPDAYSVPVLAAPRGRLVIVDQPPDGGGVRLRRFRRDGRPDATFGENGTVLHRPFGSAAVPHGPSGGTIATGPDGSIVLATAGGVTVTAWTGPAAGVQLVSRYLSDGSLDPNFGHGGTAIVAGAGLFPGAWLSVDRLALGPDAEVFLAGRTWAGFFPVGSFIARLTPDGRLDARHGLNGFAIIDDAPPWFPGLAITARGEPVLAGVDVNGARLLRLTRDGSADPSFGDRGAVLLDGANGDVVDIASVGGRGIAVGGLTACYGLCRAGLITLLGPDGRPNERFGTHGVTAVGMALWSLEPTDDFIYTAGEIPGRTGWSDAALARVRR